MAMFAIPNHDRPGYNGITGAQATWNPSKGMWVDTDGTEIRDDAITANPPAAKAAPSPDAAPSAAPSAAPAAPTAAPAEASTVGALGAMAAQPAQGFQEFTADSALNPKLGARLGTSSLRELASMAGRNY